MLDDFFMLCPDAKTATEVDVLELQKLIKGLGLSRIRSATIKRFSEMYLWEDWTYVTHLHGVGK